MYFQRTRTRTLQERLSFRVYLYLTLQKTQYKSQEGLMKRSIISLLVSAISGKLMYGLIHSRGRLTVIRCKYMLFTHKQPFRA